MSSARRVGILISGRGSNMRSLVEAAEAAGYPAEPCLVLSNRPDAAGLEFARDTGLATAVVDHRDFSSREEFDAEIDAQLRSHHVELVACAGFMRIMTAGLIDKWAGRMLNIHPSLLPSYRGLDTHERALADGVRVHGCSVHFVVPELDAGPIVAQAAVPVLTGDTPGTLAARVLKAEHVIYPQALAWVASGEVELVDGKIRTSLAADGDQALFSPAMRAR
jgi:phosphoribosylglycinamide formyltransferase-1